MSFKFHFDLRQERLLVICKKADSPACVGAFSARAARRAVKRSPGYARRKPAPHSAWSAEKSIYTQWTISRPSPWCVAAHLISALPAITSMAAGRSNASGGACIKSAMLRSVDFRQSKRCSSVEDGPVKRAVPLDRRSGRMAHLSKSKISAPADVGPTGEAGASFASHWENALRKS